MCSSAHCSRVRLWETNLLGENVCPYFRFLVASLRGIRFEGEILSTRHVCILFRFENIHRRAEVQGVYVCNS